MSLEKEKTRKTIKVFNASGIIDSLSTIITVTLSVLRIIFNWPFLYTAIRVVSVLTLINTLIWFIYTFKIFNICGRKHICMGLRWLLIVGLIMILTPNILVVIVFYIPSLEHNMWINFVSFVSPIIAFFGWSVGKSIGKKIKKQCHL